MSPGSLGPIKCWPGGSRFFWLVAFGCAQNHAAVGRGDALALGVDEQGVDVEFHDLQVVQGQVGEPQSRFV